MSAGVDLEHVANMRVAQSRLAEGDDRWYVETANGYVVRGPYLSGDIGEDQARIALKWIREMAHREAEEEADDD